MSGFLVGPFVYFHTLCVQTAKALARLRGCAGSLEPSLVAYVISTIISWAGSNTLSLNFPDAHAYQRNVWVPWGFLFFFPSTKSALSNVCIKTKKNTPLQFYWKQIKLIDLNYQIKIQLWYMFSYRGTEWFYSRVIMFKCDVNMTRVQVL